jgi:hypothetical protein
MIKKLVFVAGILFFGGGVCLIFALVFATMTPSTPTPPNAPAPAETPAAEAKPKPAAKPSKDLKTEAELRARIAELEAQVKGWRVKLQHRHRRRSLWTSLRRSLSSKGRDGAP